MLLGASVALLLVGTAGPAHAEGDNEGDGWRRRQRRGLRAKAKREIARAGLTKYLGQFQPIIEEPFAEDWVRYGFDSEGGDGPICIAGTDYSVFTKAGDPKKVIFFLQGGGACWSGFPRCNVTAEAQFPPPAEFLPGMFAETSPDGTIGNDLGSYSVVYLPYCDGSVFGGDNDVPNDPDFGVRRHRGLRNLSAGLDLAQAVFPDAETIVVAGSSAGGVGATAFTPLLVRFVYGNHIDLYVFNDAGPIALLPDEAPDAAAARVNDWQFTQFYPRSCVRQGLCDPFGQQTGLTEWRLANDSTVREAFFETDGDLTNIGFASSNVPGDPPFISVPQDVYRTVLDDAHGPLNEAYPNRYKRYIVSGDNPACNGFVVYTHTALQGGNGAAFGCPESDLYYDLVVGDIPFYEWANDFVTSIEDDRYRRWRRKKRWRHDDDSAWVDIVEEFAPGPALP